MILLTIPTLTGLHKVTFDCCNSKHIRSLSIIVKDLYWQRSVYFEANFSVETNRISL